MIVFYELSLGPSFKEDYGKMLVVIYLSTGLLSVLHSGRPILRVKGLEMIKIRTKGFEMKTCFDINY